MSDAERPFTVRRPYRCTACNRQWCVFALLDAVVHQDECVFCGLRRVRAGAVKVLLPDGNEVLALSLR